jgi:hypothetical protein
MKVKSKKLKKGSELFKNYLLISRIFFYQQRDKVNQSCSKCSRPYFVQELIARIFFGKMLGKNEMTLSEKERFRQYLTEKYKTINN